MEFDEFGDVVVNDLGHEDAIGEVAADVLLGPREGDGVDLGIDEEDGLTQL